MDALAHAHRGGNPGAVNGIVPVAETAIDVNQYMFSSFYFF